MLQDEEKPIESPLVVAPFEPSPSHNFTMKGMFFLFMLQLA